MRLSEGNVIDNLFRRIKFCWKEYNYENISMGHCIFNALQLFTSFNRRTQDLHSVHERRRYAEKRHFLPRRKIRFDLRLEESHLCQQKNENLSYDEEEYLIYLV